MYVELDNKLKIRYDEYGKNKKKLIIFIHGLGSSTLVWKDIPDALSENFHTIAIDLVGFGQSDKPKLDYSINYFVQFVEKFLLEIGIKDQEKIMLIGHSLGGYIAIEYAIKNKERIEKLVLIDSSGMLKKPTPLLEKYLDAAMEPNKKLRYDKLKYVFENLLSEPARLLPIIVHLFISVIEKEGARHSFESAFKNSTTRSVDLEKLKTLNDIPCLIVWGKKDNLIPIDHIYKFSKILSKAKLWIVEDAGHSPFVEKTAITYHKLITFLSDAE